MKITYGITVHNEADELNKLLEILVNKTQQLDEIVIVDDFSDEPTQDIISKWLEEKKDILWYKRKLDGDFASQKNYVIEKSSGDYIFHLDADEIPNEILLQQLPQILEINDTDLVWVPRINTVDRITEEHLRYWGWKTTEQGWVNYPDYQSRIFRNDDNIRWSGKVHEMIKGCRTYSHLPPHEELSLYHPKTIEKQEKQNAFYNTITR